MNKKVLIISSSPRKGGNSETLAVAFAKGAREAVQGWVDCFPRCRSWICRSCNTAAKSALPCCWYTERKRTPAISVRRLTANWPVITRNCSLSLVQTTPISTIIWRSFRLKSLTHSLRSIWDKAAYYVFLSIWRRVYIRLLLFLHRMYWNEIQTLYAVRREWYVCLASGGFAFGELEMGCIMGCVIGLIIGCAHDRVICWSNCPVCRIGLKHRRLCRKFWKRMSRRKRSYMSSKCSRKKKIDRAVDDGMSGAVWL